MPAAWIRAARRTERGVFSCPAGREARRVSDELIPIADAAEQANIHPATLRRRLAATGTPVYRHPEDWRVRVIRREDFARIGLNPWPVERTRKESAAA